MWLQDGKSEDLEGEAPARSKPMSPIRLLIYVIRSSNTVSAQNATPAEPKSARLKGKTRKEAKKEASAAATGPCTAAAKSKSFLVHTHELLPLANATVAFQKPAEIPSDIIRAGLSAVSARKRCTAHF